MDLLAAENTVVDPSTPRCCVLEHRAFRYLSDVVFRRDEAGVTPVMAMQLGDRLAAIPLRALQRELDIPNDSADGRMFGLIAQSLDFVTGLQIGDPLPAEVLDGHASWTPDPVHRAVAGARLRLQLAAWLRREAAGATSSDIDTIRRLDEDPEMRRQVNAAMEQAAQDLGLPGGTAVLGLLEDLAEEMSYIEALRQGLLNRLRSTVAAIERISQTGRIDQKRLEVLTQVRRLSTIALRQVSTRFAEIDSRSEEVLSALRNIDSHRNLIRSSRDALYRLSRAWEPILQAWEAAGALSGTPLWQLLDRTYRFLAPRYMQVQEWQAFVNGQRRARPKSLGTAMQW
jgi:hypothetical protein